MLELHGTIKKGLREFCFMKKFKLCLSLFWELFKIGLFTFGGGYAMIAVFERELVEKKNWLTNDEFTDVVAIAESTPGPLAINSATYVGYKTAGVLGSFFATLGVVLPSFIVILIISLFFDAFLELEYVNYAFRGIQACVSFLIISAGIKMLKKLKMNALNIVLTSLSIICLVLFTLFAVDFSTIFYILIGGCVGLCVYGFAAMKNKTKKGEKIKDAVKEIEEEKNEEKKEENK